MGAMAISGGETAGAFAAMVWADGEIAKAELEVKNNPNSVEARQKLETAKTYKAAAETMFRAGLGFTAIRGLSPLKARYKVVRPDVKAAEREMISLRRALK